MIYFTEEKEVKRDYANTTQGPVGGDTGRGRQKNYYKKPPTFEKKNENLPVNPIQDLSINL